MQPRQRRQRAQIVRLHGPTRGTFKVQQLSAGQGGRHGSRAAAVYIRARYVEFPEQRLERPVGVGIDVPHAHDSIAGFHKREDTRIPPAQRSKPVWQVPPRAQH